MGKKIFLAMLVGLLFLSGPNSLRGQDSDRVVILSPRVGSVINAVERERYQLFQEIRDFERAVFLQTPEKTYYARIWFKGPDGDRRDTTAQYPENILLKLAEQIDHFEDLKENRYHMGDQPAKIRIVEPEEPIVQRTKGTDIVLVLTNGQKIEGELLSVRDRSVLIAVEAKDFPRALSTGIKGVLALDDTTLSSVTVSDIEVNLSVPAERSALEKLARYSDKEPKFLQVIK